LSVYKRGRVWWYEFVFDGKRIQQSSRQHKKRVAEEMEAAHRTRLAPGEVGISSDRPRITLSEFAEQFKAFIDVRSAERPETIKFYKQKLARLLEYKTLATARLHEIDEGLIEQYIQHRRQTVSPASVNRELATLRRMLRLAWKKWKLIPAHRTFPCLTANAIANLFFPGSRRRVISPRRRNSSAMPPP
jgi:Phage integrase SAM-like domain